MDSAQRHYIGVDVSKDMLEVRVSLETSSRQVPNQTKDINTLVKEFQKIPSAVVVMEATGVYHLALLQACTEAGVLAAVVNPAGPLHFAKASGQLAKTDKIDAATLIRFAQAIPPEIREFPTEEQQTLSALVNRRQQLIGIQVAEKNRLEQAPRSIRRRIEKHLEWIDEEIRSLDHEMDSFINAHPHWQAQQQLLKSVPGVGDQISRVLLAQLPELGTCNRKEIAALVGLAPFANDSGNYQGRRTLFGGRAHIRCMLYMAALVAVRHDPVLKAMYQRLLDAGKAKKLALLAVARKLLTILNAVLRSQSPWNPELAAAH